MEEQVNPHVKGAVNAWKRLSGNVIAKCTFFAMLFLGAEAMAETNSFHSGPLFDEFDLTLAPGHRKEAAGPFFYNETRETTRTWAIPPFFSYSTDPKLDWTEYDVLYPVLSYDRFGDQYRWHLAQLWSWAGGPSQTETERRRFTLFPIYFQQRSSDPAENYTAVFPFYGHLQNRLFRDEIFFVMFPVYGQSRKKDVVTDNYLYPLFHLRHGNGLSGWQFWPLAGYEHKDMTRQTNRFGDLETVPGHDKTFALWPLYYREVTGLGTPNVSVEQGVMPFYTTQRSLLRDSTTVIWPLFSKVDDREKDYREWDAPWPLVVFADGPGKTTRRVWPFFSHAQSTNLESSFYMWPVYKFNRLKSDPLDRQRTRLLFYVYSDTIEKNTETGKASRRRDFWPLYAYREEMDGSTRLQVLAVVEPLLPTSKSIERNYSQLWSLWRDERNPRTGASSQSLLWNLYRREVTPIRRRVSLFFGLYQHATDEQERETKLFFISLGKGRTR
jgi:hypothetical protein